MENKRINNVKLGVFVLSGLLFLVLVLYMIGRNSNLFGNTYELRARFSNVQGLVVGNNIRYAGIETGTVKKIQIINDTVIEVSMIIEDRLKTIIRKNSMVSIGTEGLVGNKVINIFPSSDPADPAEENDLLLTYNSADTDEMLQILDETNRDVAEIAEDLKITIRHINSSSSLWSLLDDKMIYHKIKSSVSNFHDATDHANAAAINLNTLMADTRNGKGSIGALLTDSSFAGDLSVILENLKETSKKTDLFTGKMNSLVDEFNHEVTTGRGPLNSILTDSLIFIKIHSSLDHIENGTDRFNQNMEALKHNFLFKGYFKKQAKLDRQAQKSQSKKSAK